MKPVNHNNRYMLLPTAFKKIGEIIIVLLGIEVIFQSLLKSSTVDWRSPFIQVANSVLFIISIVFIAWSRNNDNDELDSIHRLKAIKIAFFASILYFLIMSVLYSTGTYTTPQIRGNEQVIGLLLIYLLAYKAQKNRIIK